MTVNILNTARADRPWFTASKTKPIRAKLLTSVFADIACAEHFKIITLEGDDGAEIAAPGATGELIYWGPNVSLGYAQGADDLAKGDENNGRLATGDLGYRDEDGFFFLVGRKKRFIKMYGHRVGLDEVERILAAQGVEAACAGADNDLRIFVAGNAAPAEVKALVKARTGLGPQGVSVEALAAIPRAESGKVDYAALAKRAGLAHG